MDIISGVSLDWLAFTITAISSPLSVFEFLGYRVEDFVQMQTGANGYRTRFVSGSGVTILCDGNADMGINISIPSKALSDFYEHFLSMFRTLNGVSDFEFYKTLFSYILTVGHFTRIDVCYDDIDTHYFSLDDISDLYDTGCIVSKIRTHQHIKDDNGHSVIGQSHRFGTRKSERFLRIYDKRLEQIALGVPVSSLPDSWVRWEFELKHATADGLAHFIADGSETVCTLFYSTLIDFLRIIKRDNANVSRCSLDERFADFVGSASAVHITIPKKEPALDRTERWLKSQCAPSMAAICIAYGLKGLDDISNSGYGRLNRDLFLQACAVAGIDV